MAVVRDFLAARWDDGSGLAEGGSSLGIRVAGGEAPLSGFSRGAFVMPVRLPVQSPTSSVCN